MKLDVLPTDERAWYADGLHFECTECGNCCTGGPGYVWISRQEIVRLAKHLKITTHDVVDRYCREVDGQFSLRENRTAKGEFDCIFLKTEGEKRLCTIYEVRPLQCRTWPFWAGNLANPNTWNNAAVRCPGINRGKHTFTIEQIEALRDAKDWPASK